MIRFTGPELWWLLQRRAVGGGCAGRRGAPCPSGWPGVALVAVAGVAGVLLWRSAGPGGRARGAVCLVAWALSSAAGTRCESVGGA